jgi:1-acyl-sn-glycerol-3-phosphate acyltransferase
MSFDGFEPTHSDAFVAFAPQTAERFYDVVERVARRLHVEVTGVENIPQGRALLVGNHAFGWDMAFAIAAVWKAHHRPVWTLGEHAWWKFPFVRRLAAAVGTVDGTPANAERLLENDELVLVLPGGLREAVKPRELRYRLLWGNRYGFIRAALGAQAPMVPVASVGADELFDFVGSAYERGERWTHRRGLPIPLPSRLVPIPHRVSLSFHFGQPIAPIAPADRANDATTTRRMRWEVEGALHELIDVELARRAGVAVS